MAALVCDLCGGKLMIGAGGIASCDSCGMQHNAERMKEKIQEIKGVVRIDNTHNMENYLDMAKTAYSAGNNAEAESYCNKTIEIDPKNYEAWFLKGKAAGRDSTFANPRISESTTAFIKALNFVPEEFREALAIQARDTLVEFVNNYAQMQLDIDTNSKFYRDVQGELFKLAEQSPLPFSAQEMKQTHVSFVYSKVHKLWENKARPMLNLNFKNFDLYKLNEYLAVIGFGLMLLEDAVTNENVKTKADVQAYRLAVSMMREALEQKGWDNELVFFADNFIDRAYQVSQYKKQGFVPEPENSMVYVPKYMLNDKASAEYRRKISSYEQKAKCIETDIKNAEERVKAEKARIAKEVSEAHLTAYWQEHMDEKNALEMEMEGLKQQIRVLEDEILAVPGKSDIPRLEEKIRNLVVARDSYGIFRGREKKEAQFQIDVATAQLKAIQDQVKEGASIIQKQIHPLEDRTYEIIHILTQPR